MSSSAPLVGRDDPPYDPSVQVFAVVSELAPDAIELFVREADAEEFVANVCGDEPDMAALLRVERVELLAGDPRH